MSDTLTGKYIANTYQNLVQKPDLTTETYYNGVGATISFINNDPVGTIKMFCPYPSGSLSSFFNPSTGLGLSDTGWDKWAMCDGRNLTPDLRGRFIVGHTDANPALGNSQANKTEFDSIGNIGAGINSGGSADSVIDITNIPPHRHKYFDGYMQARDGTGPFFSEILEAEGTLLGADQSAAIGGGMSITEGTVPDVDREAAYSLRNTGDGTDNLSSQDGLSSPISFYPAYYTLLYVIKIS